MIQVPFPNNRVVRVLRRIGNWLIEPSPRVQAPEQRRQAQLLSVIHLILFWFGFIAGVVTYWEYLKASRQDQVITLLSLVLVVIAYGIGRMRYFMISAVFTTIMITGAIFALAIPYGNVDRANMLIYLVLPVLLSSVLLPFRYTVRLITLQTVGMVAYEIYYRIPDSEDWTGFVFTVSITILISARYLVQRERARQSILFKTESRYQAFVENLPIGVYRTTPTAAGEFVMANPTFISLMGFASEEDLKSVRVVDIYVDPDDRTRFIETVLAQGSVSDVELHLKRKDGALLWGLVSARIVRDDNDGTLYCDCTIKDITAQKQTEAALEAGEQRYRALFDHSLNAFALHTVITDEQGKVVDYVFLEANRAFEIMTGLHAADIIGQRVTAVLPGIEDTSLIHIYGHVAQTREPVRLEQFFPPLGRHYDIAAFSPHPGQFATLFFDITARVEAENALRESEAQYRELFEGVDDAITVHDLEGRLLDVNQATCRRLGYTREELLQMNVSDLDEPGEYADGFQERVRQQIAQGQLSDINGAHITKDGRRIDIEANTKVITYHGQRAVLAVVRDMTERKRAEEALKRSEDTLKGIFRAAPIGVGVVSNRVFMWTSDYLQTMLGYSAEELSGQSARIVYESQEEFERVGRDKYAQFEQGTVGTVETRFKRKDGQLIDILLSSSPLDPEDLEVGVVFTALDITDRKRIEETLYYIAQRSWATTSDAFFDSLVQHLGKTLGVDYAFIGELDQDTVQGAQKLRMTALYALGSSAAPLEYDLAGTPCEQIIGSEMHCYPHHVQSLFPDAPILADFDVESFMAIPLWDAEGEPLGIIAIMHRTTLSTTALAESMLQVVSVRAAHELERRRAEHQLRESETRYRAVVEHQAEFIVRWTPDGTRTFVNEAYCRYFGQPREQLIGQKFLLTTDENRQLIIDQVAQLNAGKRIEPDLKQITKPDGATAWIEWFDHGIYDENGQLAEIQSVGRDVTDRILMAEQVRQERDRAQRYLDIAGVMLVALNEQGEITLINRKGREILGYAEDELIGQNWFETCLPASSRDEVLNYFQEVIHGNLVAFEHYENPVITKTGEERLIAWHNTLLHDAAGRITGTLSSGEDITERRRSEEALREQRTLAEALRDTTAMINSTLDPVRVFDRILTNLGRVVPHDFADIMMLEDGIIRGVSFHNNLGYDVDEESLRKVQISVNDIPNLRQMVETGQPCMVPDINNDPSWVAIMETRWIRSYMGAPIRVSGETIGFINVDSTQPNFFTQTHLERLQVFADQAATAINNARSYDDLERRVIDRTIDLSVRNAVAETLSNTLEIGPMLDGVLRTTVERLGVKGGTIYLIADDDDSATLNLAAHYGIPVGIIPRITGIVSGETSLRQIGQMPNHTAPSPDTGIFARLNVPIWRQGKIHGVITLVHDQPRSWRSEETRMLDAIGRQIGVALVNARLYAEAVRDEAHIRTILQSVADGLLVFDRNNNLTLMNSAAEALFSFYPPASGGAETAAVHLWDWLQVQPNLPDDPVEVSLPTIPLAQIDPAQTNAVCHLADHAAYAERDPHWPCWLLPHLNPDTDVRRCPFYERSPRCVLQANSAIVRDADGETLGTVIALHDVTYFHELDELKGRFVSTVSHELRTPLSVVLLQVSTLIKYYDRLADAQRREMVGEIQQQAHVLRELIEDILELSRFDAHRSMPQKQWFDLASHCDELILSLEPTLREKHLELTVNQRLASSYIRADPQQVMRILRNLLSNASKYTAEGGHITLEIAPVGDNVRLTVADTGIGIAPEDQIYVFDRFYRAEEASRMASGTGLGLAITKEIVDLHGGRIELDSTPGEGSTFTIYLPVYDEHS